ncbi:MAG TPA: DUF4331 domain-containing protein [Polyangiaceae bacterium]|nr:DUF4331 domain-containing protein [Polyangiaceae bacterium]
MKTCLAWLTAALAAAGTLGLPSTAEASSHREAPAIGEDPTADNTDLWAFMTNPGQPNATLTVIAAYNPLEEPSGGPNFNKFSDDVLYEVHVTRGDGVLNEVVTYQIEFNSNDFPKVDVADLKAPLGGGKEFFSQIAGQQQTYTVREVVAGVAGSKIIAKDVPVAPPNIGPRTNAVALQIGDSNDAYEQFATGDKFLKPLNGGGFVWAGPRDDGFYVDLGATFDLANFRQLLAQPQSGVDGVKGFNCHAIALEIPVGRIPAAKNNVDPKNADVVGVYASASRRKVSVLRNDGTRLDVGPFVQVSRLGLPLVNEVVIGLQDKDKWNRSDPKDEVKLFGAYFLNPVIVRDADAVGFYDQLNALGVETDLNKLQSNRVDILSAINLDFLGHTIPKEPGKTGDVLRVDLKVASSFPNGRSIPGGAAPNQEQADVTDVLASLFLVGDPFAGIGDNISNNDANYRTSFPWLARPWRGFEEGHGNFAGAGDALGTARRR